jgi:hypothetical protein
MADHCFKKYKQLINKLSKSQKLKVHTKLKDGFEEQLYESGKMDWRKKG